MACLRHGAECRLRDDGSALDDCLVKFLVLWGIDDVDPTGEDGNGAAGQATKMGRGIDAARQTRGDEIAVAAEFTSEFAGEAPSVCRSVARANYRDGRAAEECRVSAHSNKRRRIGHRCERHSIIWLAP